MDFLKQGMDAYKQYEQSQNGGNQQQQQQGGNYGGEQQQQGFQGAGAHQGQNPYDSVGVQGSAALNSSNNGRPAQGLDLDYDQIAQHASAESGHDSGLFSQALSFLNQGGNNTDVDEQKAQQAHAEAYSQGNTSNMSSESLGAAAAMQALKNFTSGSGGQQQQQSGGNMQSKLIAMALAEAQKLFANNSTGSAQQGDIVSSAGKTMMQLMLKNQLSGMTGAGSEGGAGGMSQLLGMAQKFM